MQVLFKKDKDTLTAYLNGDIDHHTAKSIRETIDSEMQRLMPGKLRLDFKNVHFMDSSGVGLILGRSRRVGSLGGQLTVQNPPPAVRKMLELAHIHYV